MSVKVAAITGAAGRIGRAIALELAKDGFAIAVIDLPSANGAGDETLRLIKQHNREATFISADVRNEHEIEHAVAAVVNELGSLDVFVANSGVYEVNTVVNSDASVYERTMDVNAKGVFLCYAAAARQMIKAGKGGVIIGASSIAGYRGSEASAVYTMAKFAVRGLTQSTALELGKHGIRVNSYAPGLVDSPMLASIDRDLGVKARGLQEGEWSDTLSKRAALGRMATAEDVANVVSFLASDKAAFISGQTLLVDGGLHFS